MPIQASKFSDQVNEMTVTYYDDTAVIGYHPDVMTPKLRREMTGQVRAAMVAVANVESSDVAEVDTIQEAADVARTGVLLKLLASWDVLDDNGKPWPITEEGLSELSDHFLNFVLSEIQRDMKERVESEGKVSANGSR